MHASYARGQLLAEIDKCSSSSDDSRGNWDQGYQGYGARGGVMSLLGLVRLVSYPSA